MPISPIKLDSFGGTVPVIDERLLPNSAAAVAVNAWLFSGRIEPIHSIVPIHTLANPDAQSVFRLPKIAPGIDYMSSSWWLEFTDPLIRVIRSPIAGQDDDGRYYWADPTSYPKMMTGTMIQQASPLMRGAWSAATAYVVGDGVTTGGQTYTAIADGINHPPAASPLFWIVTPTPLRLGVPGPHTAPGVTASGGSSSTNKNVGYVYTWVTANGEEGPPSPATSVVNKIDATYNLTFTAPLTADTANRKLTKTRIYRTVVGAQGVATYFFVNEIPITTLTYADTDSDPVVINNEQLTTTYWSAPPDDLEQLVSMPNGIVAGFRKHGEVWFCEPYYPHAWPVTYVIAIDTNIVGLGVYDQSLIILTEGQPYSATGNDPQSMALRKIQPLEPCTSRLSIVNTPNGVLFSSPNGLINITPSGAANITSKIVTKDQWNAILNLPSVAASIVSQGYYAYSLGAPAVFQNSVIPPDTFTAFQQDAFQQISQFGTRAGIYLALDDARISLSQLAPVPSQVDNVIVDIFNGETMVMRNGVVYAVDLRKLEPYGNYRWRSKIFTLPYLENLGAVKIYWTPPYVSPPVPDTVFRMFAGASANQLSDGLPLRFTEKLSKSGQIFRLPSGYKALYYQFEVEGVAVIDAIHIAQTAHELRAI